MRHIEWEKAVSLLERVYAGTHTVSSKRNGKVWKCIERKGSRSPNPSMKVGGEYYSMPRVVLSAVLRRPVMGVPRHLCGNARCLEPDHIVEGGVIVKPVDPLLLKRIMAGRKAVPED